MYIKELEVNNFKSFANDITIPFKKGFTAVAGPNGSGKSNIIDGILFALGLASARNLRMEQLSDFISTHTNKNEAYVKVILKNEDKEDEEISIARRIRKSSQGYNSVYYINDKVSTQTEILARLEKYRITPNSYNVVMQSDVMSITSCSNTERRKIIDELAGIGDFNRRIEKAKDELQIVEERVEKAALILAEIDETIKRLEKEKEAALKYQALKEEKQTYESRMAAVKYFDLKRGIELAHQNILEFNKKKQEETASLEKLEKQITELKAKYETAEELVKKNGEAEQLETKKRLEEIKGQAAVKESAARAAEKNIHDNLKAAANAENGIDNFNKKIIGIKLKIEEKNKEIQNLENSVKLKNAELEKILEEVSGLKEGADKQLLERNKLKQELEQLKEDEWNLKSENLPLETDLKIAQQEKENAQKELKKLEDFKNSYLDNKDKLSLQITELTKETEDFRCAQQNTVLELDKTKNETDDLEYEMQAARRKAEALEAKKNAYEEIGLGRNIDAVLKAGIKGVHAPLMQLGSADKKYSEALEAAMGGRMKNVVTDDIETARQCINYLKSANLPPVTFLPLKSIRKAPDNLKLPKEKGVIDYAVNLLEFDDIYLDAFFNALGETLIVEDYDSAKRLNGRYRMAALDGSLFEKSGAVTGGSRKNSGLKFNQNNDEELEKYKKLFQEMQRKYFSLKDKRKALEEKLDKIRDNYSSSMTALNGAKIELNNLNRNAQDNDDKKTSAEKIIKDNSQKIKNIEIKLEKTEAQLKLINDKQCVLSDSIKELESKMSDSALNKLKEMTSGIENEIKKLKDDIIKCSNENFANEKQIEFNKQMTEQYEVQIKKLHRDNEQLENDKKRFEEEKKQLETRAAELEETIKTLGEKLIELQSVRDNARRELLETENIRNKNKNEIDKISEQIEAFKTRRRELEPQLEEIIQELKNNNTDPKTLAAEETSTEELVSKITKLQKKMDEMGSVNMLAIEAYGERKARYDEIQGQISQLSSERTGLLDKMNGYEQIKKETFMQTYNHINENFKEIFSILTEGEGTLVLDNPDSPFDGGLTIKAQVRDKTKQKLSAMSGGEKSLTALAFVFAVQKYLPAPFYALDEVDASLDGINVSRLADMIKTQSKDTQFIVVTHKKHVLDLSDRIIGVTQKEKGKTHVTGISN